MFAVSLIILFVALALLCVTLWNALAWDCVGDARKSGMASGVVSVLIPARDEEANIAACLDAALVQGAVVREVLVYDDHSDDGTARIVSERARRDTRVRLLEPAPLPAGWCGKTFACARLAEEAGGEWLLFLDADARLGERAVERIATEAEAREITLLSCWPRIETRGFWEGMLMPLLNFVVFTLYPAPLAARRRLDASLGLAHGSCILARRDAYALVGGHAAVRDQLFEDVRLAQVWRERGQASLCLDGRHIVGVRMYRSLAEIWSGFQKNFFPAFRHGRNFCAFVALHFLVFLLPFALAPLLFVIRGAWPPASAAAWMLALAVVCVLAMRGALALRFGQSWWSVALHPLGEAFLVALGISSWLRCKTGRGVEWKGRRYRRQAESES